jgi:hypothetical protein
MPIAVVALIALAALGCAGTDGPGPGPPPGPPPPAGAFACPSSNKTSSNAGKVTKLDSSEGCLDGAFVSGQKPLFTKSRITTDKTGSLWFDLDLKSTTCNERPNSDLVVVPSASVLIRLLSAGEIRCTIGSGSGEASKKLRTPQATITVSDPVLSVLAREGQTVVKMILGFAEVQPTRGEAVLLGPGQQAIVVPGEPAQLQPIELSDEEQATFDQLVPLSPLTALAAPSPDLSPEVARILESGVLVVAVDSTVSSEAAQRFVRAFVDLIAQTWQVKAELPELFIIDGTIFDAAVSSEPQQIGDLAVLPFFQDPNGTVFQLAVPDGGVLQALREFLTSALGSGDYARLYRDAFGSDPPYGPLQDLLP